MLEISNLWVDGWEHTIRGMRNPMNSWDKSDSGFGCRNKIGMGDDSEVPYLCKNCGMIHCNKRDEVFLIGPNDIELMHKLCKAGSDHRKFMRQIFVSMDIIAPLYWVSEHDTYKVGTVRNSCSFMHKGLSKPFDISDFSCNEKNKLLIEKQVIPELNRLRAEYMETHDSSIFEAIRQILPSGYNIRYTWTTNYEVLRNVYHSRKNHRLQEWRDFCNFLETLPYAELITM